MYAFLGRFARLLPVPSLRASPYLAQGRGRKLPDAPSTFVLLALSLISLLYPARSTSAASAEATFTLDNVTVTVRSPYLPADVFDVSEPGNAIQQATMTTFDPFGEFTVIAVPFGYRPPTEHLPEARPGGADVYRASLLQFRRQQGAKLQTGPTATLFGSQVTGQTSLVELNLNSEVPKPTLIVEWVVEAGPRLWIVRISKELPQGTQDLMSSTAFLESLQTLVLSSNDLNNPTTLTHEMPDESPGMPRTGLGSLVGLTDYSQPLALLGMLLIFGGLLILHSRSRSRRNTMSNM